MIKMLIFKHSEEDAKDISVFIPFENEIAEKAHCGIFVDIFKSDEIKVNEKYARLSPEVINKWKEPTNKKSNILEKKQEMYLRNMIFIYK